MIIECTLYVCSVHILEDTRFTLTLGKILFIAFFFQLKKVISMDVHTFLSLRFRNVDTGEMRQVLGI